MYHNFMACGRAHLRTLLTAISHLPTTFRVPARIAKSAAPNGAPACGGFY